eukprot:8638327-Pyramimonas_sp.AAC.1
MLSPPGRRSPSLQSPPARAAAPGPHCGRSGVSDIVTDRALPDTSSSAAAKSDGRGVQPSPRHANSPTDLARRLKPR